ncbi:MAG: hypothetical protein ABL956_09980 [Hyphomonadaceae bacterium]
MRDTSRPTRVINSPALEHGTEHAPQWAAIVPIAARFVGAAQTPPAKPPLPEAPANRRSCCLHV